jgi:hypothetical protein
MTVDYHGNFLITLGPGFTNTGIEKIRHQVQVCQSVFKNDYIDGYIGIKSQHFGRV